MITDLVSAISAELVQILVDDNLPPLKVGKILIGRQRVLENSAPPRVLMIPMRSTWGAPDLSSPSKVVGNPHPDQKAAHLARSLCTDMQHFEVQVWGAASPPDPDADFDVTEALYKRFIRAVHHVAPGSYSLDDGEWPDQQPDAVQLGKLGHLFVFTVAIPTPVVDTSLVYAPPGTTTNPTVQFQPREGGSPEAP